MGFVFLTSTTEQYIPFLIESSGSWGEPRVLVSENGFVVGFEREKGRRIVILCGISLGECEYS